jgi:hypothetical protein
MGCPAQWRPVSPHSQAGGSVALGCGAERQVQVVWLTRDSGKRAPRRVALSAKADGCGPGTQGDRRQARVVADRVAVRDQDPVLVDGVTAADHNLLVPREETERAGTAGACRRSGRRCVKR